MRSITSYSKAEHEEMCAKYNELRSKINGTPKSELFENYKKVPSYAKYNFSGRVSSKLIELLGGYMPTPDEIIMIVDGGFSHFGASCTLKATGEFSGCVFID